MKYWRLRLENIRVTEYIECYRARVEARISSVRELINSRLPPTIIRSSPIVIRQLAIDQM